MTSVIQVLQFPLTIVLINLQGLLNKYLELKLYIDTCSYCYLRKTFFCQIYERNVKRFTSSVRYNHVRLFEYFVLCFILKQFSSFPLLYITCSFTNILLQHFIIRGTTCVALQLVYTPIFFNICTSVFNIIPSFLINHTRKPSIFNSPSLSTRLFC